jgi:hypothetical protein
MATHYEDKERAFVESLKEATGRDLAEWMAAITAQGLPHRNDIIDWLRRNGFMFSKASWLERIHHNGGKLIYADAAAAKPRVRRGGRAVTPPPSTAQMAPAPTPVRHQAAQASAPSPPALPVSAGVTAPAAPVTLSAPLPAPASAPGSAGDDDLSAVLGKAKAYRPLALAVIAQIKSARPAARFTAHEAFIAVADPLPFAHLGISAKELRLHLALGQHASDDLVQKGAPGGGLGKGETLSHMLVLTDARQIDRRLADLVERAARNVNG